MSSVSETSQHGEREQRHPHRSFRVIVNGRPRQVMERKLGFDAVVALAFDPLPTGPDTFFTVTFRRGAGHRPEGALVPGESLTIREGMIINVTATDKS